MTHPVFLSAAGARKSVFAGADICREAGFTLSAGGNHQGLITPGDGLLGPYYGNGRAKPVSDPMGTLPTRDRFAFITPSGGYDLSKVLFRMLQPHEIGRAMSFADDYIAT
ncbi:MULTISPECIES: hypothetical protein [unclassified Kitasatospora]